MSEFEDQIDSTDAICPYCGDKYQPEGEDFSEDQQEVECGECNQSYYLHQSFTVDHHTSPDCELNNRQHNWEPFIFNDGRSHDYCTICDKAAPYTKEELK